MRFAGRIIAGTIDRVLAAVRPGVTTAELDRGRRGLHPRTGRDAVVQGLGADGASRSPRRSAPRSTTRSSTGSRRRSGRSRRATSMSLDFGANWEGFHGRLRGDRDRRRAGVGRGREARPRDQGGARGGDLADPAGRPALGHRRRRPGGRRGRLRVVREYVGHGIGTEHARGPQIPNYGKPGRGPCSSRGWSSPSSRW